MQENKKYYIGMDSGGTKTAAVLQDNDGNIVSKQTGGPGNFLIIGVPTVAQTLSDLIVKLCSDAKISFQDIEAVASGHTGAGRLEDAEKMKNGLIEYWNSKYEKLLKNVFIYSDARIALEGAFSGEAGSILIAGTGSIMFGKDSNGNIHRVGGLGRFIGDEGSGYSIGRKGLAAASKFHDSRTDKSLLVDILLEKFGFRNNQDIISAVYKNNFDMASIASDVISCADKGDKICLKIVFDEIDELILHLNAMYKKLDEKKMKVAFIGGIITTNNFLANMLKKKVKTELSKIIIQDPEQPPEVGAVILAKSQLSVE